MRPSTNPTNIRPKGNNLLVKLDSVGDTVTPNSVIARAPSEIAREEMAQVEGKVLEVGDLCWKDLPEPWAKAGDRVLIAKYAGILVARNKQKYRLVRDSELLAVLDAEGEQHE